MYQITQLIDAQALQNIMECLAAETKNMMFEVDEVPSVQNLDRRLERLKDESCGVCFGAYVEAQLVGFITLERGRLRRNAGTGSLVMGVRKSHSGQGVGYALMSQAIAWGREHNMYRLGFDVRADNNRAIELYLRLGFEIEGTIRRGARIDGKMVDKYLMAILL